MKPKLLFLSILLSLATACSPGRNGEPCEETSDCVDGLACNSGECSRGGSGDSCTYDSDCESWLECSSSECRYP